jgi:hypothetical protein
VGIQCIIPKLFVLTQSEVFNKRKANKKLMMIVVKVKNKLGMACFHFLYLNSNNEIFPSSSQKKLSPPTKIKLRCKDGIVSKYAIIVSI